MADSDYIKEKWNSDFIEYFGSKKQKVNKDLAVLKRLGLLNKSKDTWILELFCGRGECQELLQNLGFKHAYGLDISETLIRCARDNRRMQVCNSVRLCYKSDTFDMILINEGLHHLKGIEQIKQCFCEVKRLLRNNGLFVFYEPANTVIRKIAVKVIFSPLGRISKKANSIKDILREEMLEYSYWLKNTPEILDILQGMGFSLLKHKKTFIHMAVISKLENKI